MSTPAQTALELAERHLTWTEEALQRAGRELTSVTYRAAIAALLGDLEHERQRIQALRSLVTAGGAR